MNDKPVITNLMLARAFWKNLHRPDGLWYSTKLWQGDEGNCTSYECSYVSDHDESFGCPVGQAIIDAGLMDSQIKYYIGQVTEMVAEGYCTRFSFENLRFAQEIQDIHDGSGGHDKERVIARLFALCDRYGINPDLLGKV